MMEFTFEDTAWEQELQELEEGAVFSAARLLTLLEDESDDALEDAFTLLQSKNVQLDLQALPVGTAQGQAATRLRQEQQLVAGGDLLSGLEQTDPLRMYVEEIAQLPVSADVQSLVEKLQEGNEEAARRLTDLSLPHVVETAKEYVGMGVLLLDLIQEGSMGLWQGILCYDGGDFESHRNRWIRHYMDRAVILQARAGGIGQKLRQGMSDYRDMDQKLLAELGRNPTVEEIAEAMHVTAADAGVYADMLRFAQSDAKRHQPEETEPQEEEQAVENTAYFQMRQRITELLSVLPETEANVLTFRFGLEGGLPMSPEETGKKLGMTANEVLAAEAAALAKLRQEN